MWHAINMVLRHAVAGVVLSWVWSFVWNTPPLFGWGSYELEGIKTSCAPNWYSRDPGNMSYIIIYLVFCFVLPFSIIVVSYSQLLRSLHQVSVVKCTQWWKDEPCLYPHIEVFLLVLRCPRWPSWRYLRVAAQIALRCGWHVWWWRWCWPFSWPGCHMLPWPLQSSSTPVYILIPSLLPFLFTWLKAATFITPSYTF